MNDGSATQASLLPEKKKQQAALAVEKCGLCNLAIEKAGEVLKAAQRRRHEHLLADFNDTANLAAHLRANSDAAWIASGGLTSIVGWWLSKRIGYQKKKETTQDREWP